MAKTPYDTDLDRNPANYQPLTPLGFLERAAAVFPGHTAIIHGTLRRNYVDFYGRARRLGSALAKRGIKRGDTVSVDRADGRSLVFTVDAVEAYDTRAFPDAKVYGASTRAELRLITCGSELGKRHGARPGNVVVYAHLTRVQGAPAR